MNLTPRAKFQARADYARAHRDLVVNEGFRDACEAAFIEQIMSMPSVVEPDEAAAAYNRILGAREYIHHLLNIAEMVTPPKTVIKQNLDRNI